MHSPTNPKEKRALQWFRRHQVMQLDQLVELLGCSVPTVRRRLKEWKTYTSYNHNGRYYVLPDAARFDAYGLWQHGSIRFSQHGTLKETVIHLVTQSEGGLSAQEIGRLLGLSPHSFLSHFREVAGLQREKVQGRLVYFAADEPLRREQRKQRERLDQAALAALPTEAEAVPLLVERIKHPDLGLPELSRRLRKQGISLSPESIRRFFAQHGLQKKTPDSGSSGSSGKR